MGEIGKGISWKTLRGWRCISKAQPEAIRCSLHSVHSTKRKKDWKEKVWFGQGYNELNSQFWKKNVSSAPVQNSVSVNKIGILSEYLLIIRQQVILDKAPYTCHPSPFISLPSVPNFNLLNILQICLFLSSSFPWPKLPLSLTWIAFWLVSQHTDLPPILHPESQWQRHHYHLPDPNLWHRPCLTHLPCQHCVPATVAFMTIIEVAMLTKPGPLHRLSLQLRKNTHLLISFT